jgi:hypothetical protein
MKFRNPWIDPRVTRLRPEDVQAYLTRHGWRPAGPAGDPHLLRFERADGPEDGQTLFVPAEVRPGSLLERMIESVAELARYQDRWAVDVLADILRQPASESLPPSGATAPSPPQPAPR